MQPDPTTSSEHTVGLDNANSAVQVAVLIVKWLGCVQERVDH